MKCNNYEKYENRCKGREIEKYKYFENMTTEDRSCEVEVKTGIIIIKETFNKNTGMFPECGSEQEISEWILLFYRCLFIFKNVDYEEEL